MIDIKSILLENSQRIARINKPYDPITGEGCQGERVRLKVDDAPYQVMYIPKAMMEENIVCRLLKSYGSVEKIFKTHEEVLTEEAYIEFWFGFFELRIKYDYEYFAYTCQTIEDGDTAEDIPFQLKRGQRKFLDVLEERRINNKPIRAIVLKARQMGLSTETQLYMDWIQSVHKKNWHSVICAHTKDSATNIRAMYEKVVENMPPIGGVKFTMTPFKNTQNIKFIPERGCRITVGTAEKPESVRGQNPKLAHFSEVAFYPNTTKKGTSQLIGSIVGPMKRLPYTMIVYESTANGVGDYFHNEWKKAIEGKSAFAPVFLPWYYDERYTEPINGWYYDHSGKEERGTIEDFILSLNEYELNLFANHQDCTLENINWYRGKNSEMSSDELMKQEYPSDDVEAFQDSGLPIFRSYHIEALRKDCRLPVSIGILSGDALPEQAKINPEKRNDILSNIRFIEDKEALTALKGSDPKLREKRERDKLKVWKYPDKKVQVSDRYVVVFDPQKGLSNKADWGVITVFDRYFMMMNGKPEIVAQWRGRIDKDIAVWIAAQIATFYNNALLVIESNTFDCDKNDRQEDDSEFIFDTISKYYYNLYSRTPADKIKEGIPIVYGWHTNRKTKTTIIANYVIMLRERGYIERDNEAFNEARVYEKKEDGSSGAKDGNHDDILMTRMIGCYICYKLPKPIILDNVQKYRTKIPVGTSSL